MTLTESPECQQDQNRRFIIVSQWGICDASFGASVALDLILQRMDALFMKVNAGAEIFFGESIGPSEDRVHRLSTCSFISGLG